MNILDALRIIYTSIVPVIPVEDLEESVFSDVCEKVGKSRTYVLFL